MSATSVQSDVKPDKMAFLVAEDGSESIENAVEVMPMKVDFVDGISILDYVPLLKVYVSLQTCETNDKTEIFMPVRRFSRGATSWWRFSKLSTWFDISLKFWNHLSF